MEQSTPGFFKFWWGQLSTIKTRRESREALPKALNRLQDKIQPVIDGSNGNADKITELIGEIILLQADDYLTPLTRFYPSDGKKSIEKLTAHVEKLRLKNEMANEDMWDKL